MLITDITPAKTYAPLLPLPTTITHNILQKYILYDCHHRDRVLMTSPAEPNAVLTV